MARDATANKASPAEHRYAAYFSIHPVILREALDRPVKRRPHCLSRLCRRTTFVDMMRDYIDQNLRCGADRLPLLLGLIDERLSFSVQALRLFDNRLRPIEKINQRLGRWQRFLNLPELCITETGNVTNEVNEPVVQHSSTLLVATNSRRATRPGEGSWWLSLCRPQERRADYPIFRRTKPISAGDCQ